MSDPCACISLDDDATWEALLATRADVWSPPVVNIDDDATWAALLAAPARSFLPFEYDQQVRPEPRDVLDPAVAKAASLRSGELQDVGVILRTYKLGKSDRIVVIHSKEHGKIRLVAKDTRRSRGGFEARLEPMSHVSLVFYRGRELDILIAAEQVEPLAPMLSTLQRTSQGLAVSEAADALSREHTPNERLYTMLVGVLRTIASTPSPLNVAAFYLRLLASEGFMPKLSMCVECDESEPASQLVAIDLEKGGGVCFKHRSGHNVSPQALSLVQDILEGRLRHALALDESPVTHEVAALATKALEFFIELQYRPTFAPEPVGS